MSCATGFWLLICAGLAGVVLLELSSNLMLAPQVGAAPSLAPFSHSEPVSPLFEAPPEDTFEEIVLRPLFSETRRRFVPPAIDADVGPAAAEPAVAVELVGTLVSGERRAALLQPADRVASWRREGEKIAGWRVVRIARDRVTMQRGEETRKLELRADASGPIEQPHRKGRGKR